MPENQARTEASRKSGADERLPSLSVWIGWFLLVGFLAGCSVGSGPVGLSMERRLLRNRLTDEEFGARISPNGERIHFNMFTGSVKAAPVIVPMVNSYRGLPGLWARLNHKVRVKMLADTGAQLCIVDAANILKSGARVYVPERWNFTVTGIGGDEHAWLARIDTVEIGTIELRAFASVVRRAKTTVRFAGLPLKAMPINLLGCPVLIGFSYVTFDYPHRKFVFSPGHPFEPSENAISLPLRVKDQLVSVPLKIGRHTVQAMVDTGAKDQVFLSAATVRKLGLERIAQSGGSYRAVGLGGEMSGRQFELPLIFLGEHPVRNVTVDTSETKAWDARIGTELLQRWRVTFDIRGKRLWLE